MRAEVSIGVSGTIELETIRSVAPRIERLGFSALWVNDVPRGDSLAVLRTVAAATDRLRLATGVIPLDRRPAEALDFAGLPHDRLTVGIGSGGAARGLQLVRDGIDAIRARIDAPIMVGALGPRMRQLGACNADGVLLNWLTPEAAAEARDDLRRDAELCGAEPAASTQRRAPVSVLYARTIIDPAARATLEREAQRYESVEAYAANFKRLGMRAMESTITDRAQFRRFDVVNELVLRAITPSSSRVDLERFVEETAQWRD